MALEIALEIALEKRSWQSGDVYVYFGVACFNAGSSEVFFLNLQFWLMTYVVFLRFA